MLYIKFKEWDIESLSMACREAKRLWYKIYWYRDSLGFKWTWILELTNKNFYTSFFEENDLLSNWYKHHKINPLRKLYYYLTK